MNDFAQTMQYVRRHNDSILEFVVLHVEFSLMQLQCKLLLRIIISLYTLQC